MIISTSFDGNPKETCNQINWLDYRSAKDSLCCLDYSCPALALPSLPTDLFFIYAASVVHYVYISFHQYPGCLMTGQSRLQWSSPLRCTSIPDQPDQHWSVSNSVVTASIISPVSLLPYITIAPFYTLSQCCS